MQMFNRASAGDKRKLVNEVVRRDANGDWSIKPNDAMLKEWSEKYLDVRKDRGMISRPAGLAAQQWGGWSGLEDARRKGDVWIVKHNEKEYYQWREFAEIEREGHRGGMSTEGSRKLDVENYKRINSALEKWEWDLKLTSKEI